MDAQIERWKEFIKLLNSHGVDHLIVGAIAFGFHAHPRQTKDIDFWIRRDEQNAERMLSVIKDFSSQEIQRSEFTREDFLKPGILSLGSKTAINIISDLAGLSFDKAWATHERFTRDALEFHYVDRDTLIESKRIAGRSQDLEDIRQLELPQHANQNADIDNDLDIDY